MEPGKLCVMGEGKNGPYYNLQCRENGKPRQRQLHLPISDNYTYP